MSNWKYGLLLAITCSIVGCNSLPEPLPSPVVEVQKPPVPWPSPVQPYTMPSFKFENIGGEVWAMISLKDYLNYSKGQVTKERFVRDLMAIVCYYQYDEKRCSKLNDK
ncbi:outer membrane lipoprotein o-spanin [Providencia phage vB_PreS_PR1]|uniref:Outer membrane lipoprotein o-spanin n=1 Tax=Providencia phage vB_PreS_PR1 TaxID=1931407 RepID=A0A1S6KV73_9CAUD|nr:Rz-like spanin [Providencia phage vB_PreS_PR1]AQT25311.1 outer membrane lipoprotein o-spanin [Providencia phage vB_PreS_PR1]